MSYRSKCPKQAVEVSIASRYFVRQFYLCLAFSGARVGRAKVLNLALKCPRKFFIHREQVGQKKKKKSCAKGKKERD